MKKIQFLSGLLLITLFLSGCRFTMEESDYIGHYEGTYRLANFTPSEGDAVLDITSAGNSRCDIMFCAEGQDSIYYFDWEVDRYSQGLYGPCALIHKPGSGTYDYDEIFVSKVDHHATLYFSDSISVDFSGDRID